MRNHTRLLLASLSLLVLSACGGDGGGGGIDARGGTARDYTRTESEVTVLPNGSGFTATRTVTLSNDDAGASRAAVRLRTVSGSVASSAAAPVPGGYEIEVTLQASAPTMEQAEEALATMVVEHRDGTEPGALYLDTEVEFARYQASNVNRTASVAATLPAALDYELYQASVNGTVSTAGLGGTEAQLYTTQGTVDLAGTWDAAAANSVQGSVSASGDIASLQASTVNGSVTSSLSGARDSVADLEATQGSIDAAVKRTLGSTFDLVGRTDLGSVTIFVAGTEPVGTPTSTSAHYRSPDFSSGSPRVTVTGRTSTGSVTIHE